MARVFLVGSGPLPGPDVRQLGFPQLRLSWLQEALQGAGHTVTTAALGADIDPESAGWLEVLAERGRGAEVVVSAGPYLPGMAACLIARDRPVWADLPGDPFAELQAAFRVGGVDTARHAAARAAALAVLSRADGISVISPHQRHACLGQLGVLDRLNTPPTVGVVPVAYRWPLPRHPPRTAGPLRIALSGGFNTWLDEGAIIGILEALFTRDPTAEVVCTGGGIQGHHTAGAERFSAWARQQPQQDRITLHGWLPHRAVGPVIQDTDIGLIVDAPGAEAELGSRTRALMFAWLGVQIAATPVCALLSELAGADLLLPLTGRPEDAGLLRRDPDRVRRADAFLSERYALDRTVAPLLRWLEHPQRAPPAPEQDALVAANARLSAALQQIHQSPTWRLLSPIHRALQRLTARRRSR